MMIDFYSILDSDNEQLLLQMGNVCTVQYQGQNYKKNMKNRNTVTKGDSEQWSFEKNKQIADFKLGQYTQIKTLLGHYTNHSGSTLVILSTIQNMNYCEQIRQYAQDWKNAIEKVKEEKNRTNILKVKKECPYQKMVVCIMPEYNIKDKDQNQLEEYYKNFRLLVRSLFQDLTDVTLHFSNTSQQGVVFPTQTILSLLFLQLHACVSKSTKIYMISTEIKMLHMIRYEVQKTQACTSVTYHWDFKGQTKLKQN